MIYEPKEDSGIGIEKPPRRETKIITSLLRSLILLSLTTTACAHAALDMLGNVDPTNTPESASAQEGVTAVEFNASLGREIHSDNGRALVIVHEGRSIDPEAGLYVPDIEAYQLYLRRIEARKQIYMENNDPLVIVIEKSKVESGEFELTPRDNVLYYITENGVGVGASHFNYQDQIFTQLSSIEHYISGGVGSAGLGVWDLLKQAGVSDFEVAGEEKGGCAAMVAKNLLSLGFSVEWCQGCVYDPMGENKGIIVLP